MSSSVERPAKAITLGRPVVRLASFTADSTPSAPELQKKNESRPAGVTSDNRAASCSSNPWRYTLTWAWMNRPACSRIAATTLGWQCPVEVTAIPDEKSR